MKKLALTTSTAAALLVLTALARCGDDKDLRAIINKGLEASGGEAKLAKFTAQTLKGGGKFFGLGEAIDFTVDITFQGDKQFRFGVNLQIMGQDVKVGAVVNGDKGWEKLNDDVKDMPAEELA
jgi:hypothetical protein